MNYLHLKITLEIIQKYYNMLMKTIKYTNIYKP